ncbi:MAG: hypothetical protein Q7R80_03785 [bacterium]|nr:hypothetical protein [bacterium]
MERSVIAFLIAMRGSFPRISPTGRRVAAAILVAAIFVLFTTPALAATNAADLTRQGLRGTANTAGLGTAATPLPVIIGNIIYAALSLTGIIFVLLTIYGGFIWMQARGNEEDVTKAKKIIESAIIGIIIAALAFAITSFVITRITDAQSATSAPAAGAGG